MAPARYTSVCTDVERPMVFVVLLASVAVFKWRGPSSLYGSGYVGHTSSSKYGILRRPELCAPPISSSTVLELFVCSQYQCLFPGARYDLGAFNDRSGFGLLIAHS